MLIYFAHKNHDITERFLTTNKKKCNILQNDKSKRENVPVDRSLLIVAHKRAPSHQFSVGSKQN